jgi:hypothetical protein
MMYVAGTRWLIEEATERAKGEVAMDSWLLQAA